MRKSILLFVLVIFCSSQLFSQTLFKGIVVDEQTKQAIPYAKIGVSNQGAGVIAKENGRFAYRKYDQTLDSNSELVVSAKGYKTLRLDVTQLREIYDLNSTIVLSPGKDKKTNKEDVVSVFWDMSEGMIDRDVDKELAFLENYLSQLGKTTVNFVIFNDKIQSWKKEEIVGGDISRFRESVTNPTYSGPANYDVLQPEGADEILLFSNGDPTFGILRVSTDIPVHSIVSTPSFNQKLLDEITQYTDGSLNILTDTPLDEIANAAASSTTGSTPINATTITGKVVDLDGPLQGARILKLGTFDEAITDAKGVFSINAIPGDILAINSLGMFEKRVVVEENTAIEVTMIPESDVLEEVVITGKKEKIIVGNKIFDGRPSEYFPGGTTSFGDFYITANDITPNARTLEQLVREKFKAVTISNTPSGPQLLVRGRRPAYVLNGRIIGPGEPAPLYLKDAEIETIVVKYGSEVTGRYSPGTLLSSVAVIVTTKNSKLVRESDKYNPLVKGNDYTDTVTASAALVDSKASNNIKGKVTSQGKPIQGAVINIKNTFDEYRSDVNGNFNLSASAGDEVIVSYLGMYTKGVEVDSSGYYEIDLIPNSDVLDEVKLAGKGREERSINTPLGKKNLDAVGYDVKVLTKEDIGSRYPDLGAAINGKFANVSASEDPIVGLTVVGRDSRAMLIIIDNQIFTPDTPRPFISPDRVKTISIIKSIAGTARYGTLARGGLVEIVTQDYANPQASLKGSALAKNNEYTDTVKSIAQRVTARSSRNRSNKVTGKVSSSGKALQGASITRKGSFDEYYTAVDGTFEVTASPGDVLVFKSLGMYKKEVLVENQANIVVELLPNNESLDEIVVSGNRRVDNTIETAYGSENQDKIGYDVDQISSESFSQGATNLRQLITGKFPGVRVIGANTGFSGGDVIYQIRGGNQSIENDIPPAWVVNGVVTDQEPSYIDVSQIENISVLKSTIATNKYGTIAAGGAFVITTKGLSSGTKAAAPKSALVTGNNYVNDAIAADLDEQEYITQLRQLSSIQEKFSKYRKMSRTQDLSLEFYSDMARYFQKIDLESADKVRSDLAFVARKNAKAMRTLAYLYEEAGDVKKTLLTYESILKLVPNEAQSYRDVANAYVLNGEYNKALEVYINTLGERVKGVDFTGIEKVLKTELSRLVQRYKDKIEFTRLPNEWLRADFKQDVRMVIEWTDATVPFEFQFVNPDKKFFKWNHTLEENRERLVDEQKQGFQIEEFIIDDAPQGDWLINVEYLGLEDDYVLPPFLKYTLYRNYGTPQETKEVRVIKLFRQTEKVTLAKVQI